MVNTNTQRGRVPLISIAIIGMVAHSVNKAYCAAIGDTSQLDWNNAPDWQKQSAMNGVLFHLENETTAEASHENWMREKLKDGWTYGPEKDANKKEHPCLVSYHLLPQNQQIKDHLFRSVVNALSIPAPKHDNDMVPVVNVHQFADYVGAWHENVLAKVKQMGEIPTGTEVEVSGSKVTLAGDIMTAFQAGLLTAISEFEVLPFGTSEDVEIFDEPAQTGN